METMNKNQIIQEKDTITQKDLEDVARTILEDSPKDPEFVTFETPFGTISFLKDDPKYLHE